LLVVAAAVVAVIWLLVQLRTLVIVAVFALFLTALLAPPTRMLIDRTRLPPSFATALTMLAALVALAGIWALIVPAFISQLGDLGNSLETGIADATRWLTQGPLDLTQQEIDDYVDRGVEQLGENSGGIASGFFSGALVALELVGAALLGLIASFFLIRDGEMIWRWIVGLFSPKVREPMIELGERCWGVVGRYLRGVSIVATFDAVLIGVALVILGVPAALPLAILTFFGAFIPFAGAFAAGLIAALVALVSNGVGVAIIVVVIVIVVQQIEGDLLYPLVVGQSVDLHPLAILVAITAGAVLAGILGAIIAIPIAAVVGQALAYSRERRSTQSPSPAATR